MKPGRFDEQPIPEITANSWGLISSSAQARKSALRTPKSPQPGHQSGDTSGLKSFTSSLMGAVAVAIGMETPEEVSSRQPCLTAVRRTARFCEPRLNVNDAWSLSMRLRFSCHAGGDAPTFPVAAGAG